MSDTFDGHGQVVKSLQAIRDALYKRDGTPKLGTMTAVLLIDETIDNLLGGQKAKCSKCNDTGWCCADQPDPHRCRCGTTPRPSAPGLSEHAEPQGEASYPQAVPLRERLAAILASDHHIGAYRGSPSDALTDADIIIAELALEAVSPAPSPDPKAVSE